MSRETCNCNQCQQTRAAFDGIRCPFCGRTMKRREPDYPWYDCKACRFGCYVENGRAPSYQEIMFPEEVKPCR